MKNDAGLIADIVSRLHHVTLPMYIWRTLTVGCCVMIANFRVIDYAQLRCQTVVICYRRVDHAPTVSVRYYFGLMRKPWSVYVNLGTVLYLSCVCVVK